MKITPNTTYTVLTKTKTLNVTLLNAFTVQPMLYTSVIDFVFSFKQTQHIFIEPTVINCPFIKNIVRKKEELHFCIRACITQCFVFHWLYAIPNLNLVMMISSISI